MLQTIYQDRNKNNTVPYDWIHSEFSKPQEEVFFYYCLFLYGKLTRFLFIILGENICQDPHRL